MNLLCLAQFGTAMIKNLKTSYENARPRRRHAYIPQVTDAIWR